MSNRLKVNQKEIEQLNLRSEEVREIMGHIPSKLIRYGITIVFFVVFLIIISSFFFKYPDVIDANFEIVTQNPPAEIIAKSNGNLSHIFVTDSQSVEVNTLLGVIQNPANTDDILRLRSKLINIERQLYSPQLHLSLPDSLQLGELQSFYYSLLSASLEYHQFIELRYFEKKIRALHQKEKQLLHYLNNSLQQFDLKKSELELTERQYSRDSILFDQELISASNYEKSKKTFIQEKIALQSKQSTVINTHLQINELKQQIVELQLEQKKQVNLHKQKLTELFSNLDSKVAWWFDQYALISPICGNVAFNKIWSDNQFISAGTHVFSIIPDSQQTVIGRVTLESAGVGKIKPNQDVNLKLDNYPFQEFGMIRARVKSISLLPVNGEYFVDLDLPDLLVTNYGINIPFSQKMPGVAEIITEDLPLIVRLVNPLKDIIMSQLEGKDESRQRIKSDIPIVQNNNENELINSISQDIESTKTEDSKHDLVSETKHLQKEYHVIAASFVNEQTALLVRERYQNRGYQSEVLKCNNGKIRLSLYSNNDKQNVYDKLISIRNRENNNNIWLLSINSSDFTTLKK